MVIGKYNRHRCHHLYISPPPPPFLCMVKIDRELERAITIQISEYQLIPSDGYELQETKLPIYYGARYDYAVCKSVEFATPRLEVLASIPAPGARSLLGWGGVSATLAAETEAMAYLLYLCLAARKIGKRQSWDPSAR